MNLHAYNAAKNAHTFIALACLAKELNMPDEYSKALVNARYWIFRARAIGGAA